MGQDIDLHTGFVAYVNQLVLENENFHLDNADGFLLSTTYLLYAKRDDKL